MTGAGRSAGEQTSSGTASRREQIAEAALHLLSEQGMGRLTHRAVDRSLALPEGSTSFYFRRREELLAAAARRSVELNLAMLHDIFAPILHEENGRATLDRVAERLLAFWRHMMGPAMRYRVVGRIEIYLEALRSPALQAIQADELKLLDLFWAEIFRRIGAPAPMDCARAFGVGLRGAMYVHSVTPYTVEGSPLTEAGFFEQLTLVIGKYGGAVEGAQIAPARRPGLGAAPEKTTDRGGTAWPEH